MLFRSPRSVNYLLIRGARYNSDGSLSASSEPVTDLLQKISSLTEEVNRGIRNSDRENDVLTQALGTRSTPVAQEEPGMFLGRKHSKVNLHPIGAGRGLERKEKKSSKGGERKSKIA